MQYRLDELAKLALECGFTCQRVEAGRLEITLQEGCILVFCNFPDDTFVGFEGTPWHSHGSIEFWAGRTTYIECDELAILIGIGSGELVVVSQFFGGLVSDRWLAHRHEPLDLKYMKPGEELRVLRLSALDGNPT